MHVPSDAWLQQDTVFNNIVFGLPLIDTKMDKIMKGCSLREDLEKLPLGENTMCEDQVRENFAVTYSDLQNQSLHKIFGSVVSRSILTALECQLHFNS